MSLDTARRVLKSKRKRFKTSWRAWTPASKSCGPLVRLQGPRRCHRHGKIRPHRPKNLCNTFQHRNAILLLTRGGSSARDMGMLARGDALLAVSYGGETEEIVRLLEALKRLEMRLVTLTGKIRSTLAEASDVVLDVSVKEEACSMNLAPTASTTVAMAVGDALAVSLLERRGFRPDDFAALHPAGSLGKKLLRVEHLMHAGEALPRVRKDTPMPDVFHEMSAKKLGMTTVLEPDGRLAGILTDGDLRRLMEKHRGAVLEMRATDGMTKNPQTIGPHVLASEALNLMEKKKITSIVVVDEANGVLGVVHLHDLWTLELI